MVRCNYPVVTIQVPYDFVTNCVKSRTKKGTAEAVPLEVD